MIKKKNKELFLIEGKSFSLNGKKSCDNYDTVELYYHAEVPDVTDDDGNLNDPDETVGSKLFNKFADDPDVDEIYVRNPFLMIDFHLQRELLK